MHRRAWFVALAASAQLAFALAGCTDAETDKAELESYRLTMPVMEKLLKVNASIYASVTSSPTLAATYRDMDERRTADESLAEMIARSESISELKSAIAGAGLSTREWIVANFAVFVAALDSGVEEIAGHAVDISTAARANIAFLQTHDQEFKEWGASWNQIDVEVKRLTKTTQD